MSRSNTSTDEGIGFVKLLFQGLCRQLASLVGVPTSEEMDGSQKPFLWLGHRILPYLKDFGGDLDALWQYPILEKWVKENFLERKSNNPILKVVNN